MKDFISSALLRQLVEDCQPGSVGAPRIEKRYLCIGKPADYQHYTKKPGWELFVIGSAKREAGFRYLAHDLGVCLECFEDIRKSERPTPTKG